jgi:cystathionine beta-lyase
MTETYYNSATEKIKKIVQKLKKCNNEIISNTKTAPIAPPASEYKMETQLVYFDKNAFDKNSISMPLYQTSTFVQPKSDTFGAYDYTRSGNPTRTMLQSQFAMLDKGKHALCYSTGMAAISSVLKLVNPGDEIILNGDMYGGTYRLLTHICEKYLIILKIVDLSGFYGWITLQTEMTNKTRLVMIESPTNPLQKICDIQKLARVCKNMTPKCLLFIDNSMMSPVLCNPLCLGADIVMHSTSKYICGHSDTMGGVVILNDTSIATTLKYYQNAEGNGLSPFDCWLVNRSLKTLALRMEKQQHNANIIANWLTQNGLKVHYVGLHTHPHHHLHFLQASGAGAVVSFETGDFNKSTYIVNNTLIFKISVSFGSMVSLISLPAKMSHASIPPEKRLFPDDLIRLSIGIENVEDLIADLARLL